MSIWIWVIPVAVVVAGFFVLIGPFVFPWIPMIMIAKEGTRYRIRLATITILEGTVDEDCEEGSVEDVNRYLKRLIDSTAKLAMLVTSQSNEEEIVLCLSQQNSGLKLKMYEDSQRPEKEDEVRAIFTELGIDPESDYRENPRLVLPPGMGSCVSVCYVLPTDFTRTSQICRKILEEVYNVSGDDRLSFAFV